LVNTEEKYQYRGRGTSLQIASEFMHNISVCHYNVISNTTVKCNTCSFDNKCEKLWIVVYNQSATLMYMPVRHYKQYQDVPHFHKSCQKTNLSSSSLRFCVSASNNGLLCHVCTPSADPQRSSLHIHNIETPTAINDIMAPDKYQTLLWDPQLICLGFLLK